MRRLGGPWARDDSVSSVPAASTRRDLRLTGGKPLTAAATASRWAGGMTRQPPKRGAAPCGEREGPGDEGGGAGVGLSGERQRRVPRQLVEDLEQALRPHRAVRADGRQAEAVQARGALGRRFAGQRAAVVQEGHLRDEGQLRRRLSRRRYRFG